MQNCIPSLSGPAASKDEPAAAPSMMGQLSCGLNMLFFGTSGIDPQDLPQSGSETWQWAIESDPKALRIGLVVDPKAAGRAETSMHPGFA